MTTPETTLSSSEPAASKRERFRSIIQNIFHRFRHSEYALPLSILGALVLFIYWDVIFGDLGLLDRDMLYIHLPMRMHFVNRILQGEFPEWYPFDGLGSSYIANAVPGLLHPTVLLHFIFSHVRALSLSAVLAHFLAGAGSFCLLKYWKCGKWASLVGAVSFAFTGYLMSMDGNLPYLNAAAAIPWAILALEKNNIPLCSVSMWWIAVSGERMHTLYFTSLFLLADVLASPERKKHFITLSLAGVGALLLSAPHLLPAALASGNFAESGEDALRLARSWPLYPLRIFEMWSPGPILMPDGNTPDDFFQLQEVHSYWANALYVGAFAIISALIALRWPVNKRPIYLLAGLGLITFCSALGTGTDAPLFHLFQKILPGFSLLRYPEKNFVFVAFSLAMLSGFGTEQLLSAQGFRSVQVWTLLSRGLLMMAALNLLLIYLIHTSYFQNVIFVLDDVSINAQNEFALLKQSMIKILLAGAILAAATVMMSIAIRKFFAVHPMPFCLMIFVVAMTGVWKTWGGDGCLYRRYSTMLMKAPNSIEQNHFVKENSFSPFRIFAPRENNKYVPEEFLRKHSDMFLPQKDSLRLVKQSLSKNISALYNLENIAGYLPIPSYGRQALSGDLKDNVYFNGFNVRYALRQKAADDITSIDDLYDVIVNENAGERIRLVRGIPVHSMEEAFQIANAPNFNAVTDIPVEIPAISAADYPESAPENAQIDIITYSPEYIELNTTSETPATLFVADAFADGWTAEIDGQAAPIYPGLIAGRAVPLSKGTHKVIMTYKTPGLRIGLFLSILGWLSMAGFILVPFWRQRKPLPAAGDAVNA